MFYVEFVQHSMNLLLLLNVSHVDFVQHSMNLLLLLNMSYVDFVQEKSQLDWNKFKQQEGLEEELQVHNRGKEG